MRPLIYSRRLVTGGLILRMTFAVKEGAYIQDFTICSYQHGPSHISNINNSYLLASPLTGIKVYSRTIFLTRYIQSVAFEVCLQRSF